MSGKPGDWAALWAETMLMSTDAAWVMGMRAAVLAGGGDRAMDEFAHMTGEKLRAHADFAGLVMTGRVGLSPDAFAGQVLKHYGPVVRANRQRLSAGEPDGARTGRESRD